MIHLKRKIDCLQSQRKDRSLPFVREREKVRSARRRAKSKVQNFLSGHKRVKVADIPQPKTSLHSIDFAPKAEEDHEKQLMEEADGPGTGRRTRGPGTTGVIGMESVIIKLPGPKHKRQTIDGNSPGGLEWDNRVLLNAVLLYILSHASLKEAGSAGVSFLSIEDSFGDLY